MTAPSIIKRRLTFHFERSVNAVTGKPNTMEIVVGALSNPTSAVTNTTFVDDPQAQTVVLGGADNTCVFELIPSDDPSLSERLLYRVSWRSSYLGKQYSYDFAMPDQDADFDDLFGDLQSIMDWHVYLQQSDLGVPGRVARLNLAGQVVDAAGVPITGDVAAAVVQNNLDAEVVNRQKADRDLRVSLETQLSTQITSVTLSAQTNLDRAIEAYENADAAERATRQREVGELNAAVTALTASTASQISGLQAQTATLPGKADLGPDGKLLSSQLPSISLGRAVTVANEAAMLALTSADVQPGDFVVRPDGVWYLSEPNPQILASWVKFTVAPLVSSINGRSGDVTLAASDVGARPAGVALAISDTAGLQAALDGKATSASVSSLATRMTGAENRLTAIEAPTSAYVRTSNGVVPTTLLGADVPRLTGQNILVNSQGFPISIVGSGAVDSVNGQTGVVVLNATDVGARAANVLVNIAEISGLPDALADKVSTNDSRLTNSRTPTSHASTHASGGSDPITPASIGARAASQPIPIADVTGLQTALDSKGALTTQTQQATRIYSLETRVDSLEGQGGFGGISAFKVEAWDAPARITPSSVAGFATDVVFKSPFGKSATTGGFYYDPSGVAAGEAVWPYISPNGHLELRKWNESAPADTVYAPLTDLTDLQAAVTLKANASDLTVLQGTVATKANQTDLASLSSTVSTKANQTDLTALTASVTAKASQSSVDNLSAQLSGKANQTDLTALTTRVSTVETGKASQTDLTALTTRVSAVETGKASTTTVNSLTTRVSAVETGKANQSELTALTNTVAGKANMTDLAGKENTSNKNVANGYAGLDSAGRLFVSQMPVSIMEYQGTWNAATNSPALANGTGSAGDVYRVGTAGTRNLGSGSISFDVGDYVIYNGTAWEKSDTTDAVASVNGQTGVVVLGATDVGARPLNVQIAQSEVSGLSGALNLKADDAAVKTSIASRPSWSVAGGNTTTGAGVALEGILTASSPIKLAADYVTTGPLTWPFSGPQTIDGINATNGKIVLVNNQSDSTQHGLWVVNGTGTWTRATDQGMAAGSYLVRGSLVLVRSGNTYANTLWQVTSSGVIGTDRHSWGTAPVMYAGPPVTYTAGDGLEVVNGTQFKAKTAAGSGIAVTSAGISVDRARVPNKYAADVPSGSAIVTITHGLNTTDICSVTVIEKATGDVKLLGWTVTGVNTISLEFAAAPTSSTQYRCIVAA